jgi:mannan endo-1,4-beta-mannosidase
MNDGTIPAATTSGHAPSPPAAPAPASRGRRTWPVLAVAALIVIAAIGLVIRHAVSSPAAAPPAVHASLPSRAASYLGVYEPMAPSAYQQVAGFTRAAGQQPNVAGYFSGWAQPFADSFARQARAHGAVPLIQVDPTYASVKGIAAGAYDVYLRSYADSVRRFGHPVIIGFGHEMNAPWYSWGYRHVPARTFVAAWRHIVTLFRGQGADNVTWLWTINDSLRSTGPLTAWWPGAAYVTWVGIDGYFYRPSDTFTSVFGNTIRQVRSFSRKPVLLSETAVGPHAGQPGKIGSLFSGMRRYRTLGLVWFDEAQHGSIYQQDWRLEDSPAAEATFRRGVQNQLQLSGKG